MFIIAKMMPIQYIADAEKDANMKSLSQEEAVEILSDMKIDIPVPKAAVTQRKRNVALDMAISALSCSEIPNSSDLISRQAAIDAAECIVEHHSITPYKTMAAAMDHLKRILNGMPSAQPETNCSEIPNNSDTIYRQAAIDALDKEYRCTDRSDDWEGLKTAMLIIENLPSVQSRLNKKRISDLLWNEYRTMSPHLSAEGVVARRYYCKELWKELFGEEETPVWMTW